MNPENTQMEQYIKIGNHILYSLIWKDFIICETVKHGMKRLAVISAKPFNTVLSTIFY